MSMGLSEVAAFEALRRRVDALEHEMVTMARTAASTASSQPSQSRKENAAQLREAIAQVVADNNSACAKQILQALARNGMTPLPSLRTVQLHLRAVRNSNDAPATITP